MPNISVSGIVSVKDDLPYVLISVDDHPVAQMSMAEARNVARDIEIMCSRTEADAIIYKFFRSNNLPLAAAVALMHQFRKFRSELDAEVVNTQEIDPDANTPSAN